MIVGARVTSKGQVTIPKPVRDALGIDTGDSLIFSVEDGRAVVRRAPGLMELAGTVPTPEDVEGRSWQEVRLRAREARHTR